MIHKRYIMPSTIPYQTDPLFEGIKMQSTNLMIEKVRKMNELLLKINYMVLSVKLMKDYLN